MVGGLISVLMCYLQEVYSARGLIPAYKCCQAPVSAGDLPSYAM